MKPLGQPVGKRFVRTDYAGYIVGFDHRREGGSYLVRYEDVDLLEFPARELDTYRVPARNTHCLIVNTTKLVLSLCPLFPQGSNERETLRQFVSAHGRPRP